VQPRRQQASSLNSKITANQTHIQSKTNASLNQSIFIILENWTIQTSGKNTLITLEITKNRLFEK
jgi:hypothetical protein